MKEWQSFTTLIRCPCCHVERKIRSRGTRGFLCSACGARYPNSHGRPVLLSNNNEIFRLEDYVQEEVGHSDSARTGARGSFLSPSVNLSNERVLGRLARLLSRRLTATVLVVGAGQQRVLVDESLGASSSVQIVYSDIDSTADVDLFCDAHELPFVDQCFDAIVTTAVLEHVLYPERVAEEIRRVLKVGGFLYSELPFMQQVHEGAYDFTRYTLSGHRRLFNYISEIESGIVAGPGTALVWAIENFFLAFVSRSLSRKVVKSLARLFFGWIKYFDYVLAHKPQAVDGASCTYLFGSKSNIRVPDAQIIASYVGAKHLRHT